MTKFVKNSEIKSDWYEIDAKNAVVGRLATIISIIIRGKNKNTYTRFKCGARLGHLTIDYFKVYEANYGLIGVVPIPESEIF